MSEPDALLNLKVNDAALYDQFAAIEKALQRLGAVNLGGLNSSLKSLTDQLSSSSEVMSKLATSSQTSANAVAQAESKKQVSFDKTAQDLLKYSNKIVSEIEKTIVAENRAASAIEAAELKKQKALAQASQAWEKEVSKQQAIGDKQASDEAKNALVVMGALQQIQAGREKTAAVAEAAAKAEVAASQRAIQGEKFRQESIMASLLMYERLSSAAATAAAPLRRAGLNEYQNAWNYQRNESPLYSSLFDQAGKRDNEEFNKEQQRRQAQMSSRERFQQEKDLGPGNASRQSIVDMYSGMYDEIAQKEQASLRKSLADRESYVRSLKSQVESSGGMKNFGPENSLNVGEQKEILSLIEAQGMQLRARPSIIEKELGYMARMAVSWIALGTAVAVVAKVAETYEHSIQKASEFQVQGVLFGQYQDNLRNSGSGVKVDNTSTNQVLAESIKLATQYGDEVNDVSQDLALWYKRTGDLNSAQFLTNETLKFQLATGTHIEDLYRTLTGLSAQAGNIPLNKGDARGFGLEQTPELLNKITAAAVVAGAGLHQVNAAGKELGASSANAADLLLQAMDKDTAALGTLGYSLTDAIAINASLIQSFGNTGGAASEAAEKIARITGGIAAFSKPNLQVLSQLKKEGIDVSNVFDTHGDVLDKLAKKYEGLNRQQQDELAIAIAGQRQFEALEAILTGIAGKTSVLTAMKKNMSAEDRLALDMEGTYQIQLKKTEAAWEGLEVVVGQGMLPVLQQIVSFIGTSVVPALAAMANAAGNSMNSVARTVGYVGAAMEVSNGLNNPIGAAHGLAQIQTLNKQSDLNDLREAEEASGPVYGRRQYHDKSGKLHVETQKYNNRAQFLASHNTAMGAPADTPAELRGYEGNYALQNMNNTFNPQLIQSMQKIKDLFGNQRKPTDDGSILNPNGPGGNKDLKDYQIAGEAIADLRNQYQDLTEKITENKNAVEGAIASDKTRIQTFGLTSQTLQPLLKDLAKKKSSDTGEISQLRPFESQFENLASSNLAKAKSAGLGTVEGKGFLQDYYQAESEARRIRAEISGLKKDMSDVDALALDFQEKLAKTNIDSLLKSQSGEFNQLDKKFNDARSAGSKSALSGRMENLADSQQKEALAELNKQWPLALRGSVEYQAELGRINDTYTTTKEKADAAEAASVKFNQSLSDKFDKGIFDQQQKGLDALISFGKTGNNSKQAQELENQVKLIRELHDETIRYNEDLRDSAGNTDLTNKATQFHALTDEVIYTSMAVDKFKEKLDNLHNSDWYKAIEAGFSEMGKLLEKSIMDSAFGNNKYEANIQGIDATISALDQQKQIEEEMFSLSRTHSAVDDANHKLALLQIQQQITAENRLKQAQKDRMDHPGFIKSTLESISSSYVNNYIKQVEGSLLAGVGGGQDQQKEVNKALQSYADATTKDLTRNVITFKDAVSAFGEKINAYKEATTGSGGSSGNLTDNLSSFTDAINNPTSGTPGATIMGQAGPTLAAASALGLNLSNSEKNGQNVGGGSSTENAAKSSGVLGSISQIGTALGLSMSKTPLGSALTIAGGSFKGGAGGPNGIGAYLSTAGNIDNSFATSSSSGIGATLGAGAGLAFGHSAAAAAVGSAIGGEIGSFFGPHYSSTTNPDMYASSGYAQGEANAVGKSYTSSNGNVLENSTLQQGLGNQSELGYIDQFVKAHPGGAGLTGASLDMWNQANTLTGGGAATTLGYGGQAGAIHQGQQGVMDASGKQIGGTQNWQDLLTTIDNTTQQLVTFNGGLNAANASLVVLNQFGSGQGVTPGAWDTPGVAANPANYTSSPLATSVTGSGAPATTLQGGILAQTVGQAVKPLTTVNGASAGTQSITLQHTTNLDGKQIAVSTQAYQLRAQQSGFSYVS